MESENKNQGFVINSPYFEPKHHFEYDENSESYHQENGRRKAGYYATIGKQEAGKGSTEFLELELANMIRYFWCQIEAIETIIWLVEAPDAAKVGINLKDKSDSDWMRACTKLATGTGKTVVMAMIIAWQALNKIANPKDTRFSKNILVMAPGITVRHRLSVLIPSNESNYYNDFDIIPSSLKEYIYQAKIVILNWQAIAPKTKESLPKVMREMMGEESENAFTKRVLSELPGDTPILVINDEAHHCHRQAAEIGKSKEEKDQEDQDNKEATIWVQGLDKIHKARGIITAYDMSATPFIPKGRTSNTGFELFNWIISDFGLHDAIESGLVKTPTIAVRDSSYSSDQVAGDKSKLFHIYYEEGIKEDLNKKCEPNVDLPDLVRNAFKILSTDWLATKNDWREGVPPSMIVICNNTFTSHRIEYSILNSHLGVSEISEKDKVLRIDSTVEDIEDDTLREKFNTVGKQGKPGADIQCVIGVNMLSEGWDANNVKQILGLRAFTSQLLCEQVVGRGLRRMSYDVDENTRLLKPEYVTVFGIPFSFLPIEGKGEDKLEDEKPKTFIQVLPQKKQYQILFPNILRIQKETEYFVNIDWSKTEKFTLSPTENPVWVQVAPTIDRPDLSQSQKMDSIQEYLGKDYRLKQTIFAITTSVKNNLDDTWKNIDDGDKFRQIFKIVSDFIDKNVIIDADKDNFNIYKNILISLNTTKITSMVKQAINLSQDTKSYPIPDPINKFKTTSVMTSWYTIRDTYSSPEMKCQISHLVLDSKWENIGKILDNEIDDIVAWVKNDHLAFTIPYIHKGLMRSYFPDFIIKYAGNRYLLLEVKGKEREQDQTKWDSANLWCEALNTDKDSWGEWKFRVVKNKPGISDLKWE